MYLLDKCTIHYKSNSKGLTKQTESRNIETYSQTKYRIAYTREENLQRLDIYNDGSVKVISVLKVMGTVSSRLFLINCLWNKCICIRHEEEGFISMVIFIKILLK